MIRLSLVEELDEEQADEARSSLAGAGLAGSRVLGSEDEARMVRYGLCDVLDPRTEGG